MAELFVADVGLFSGRLWHGVVSAYGCPAVSRLRPTQFGLRRREDYDAVRVTTSLE
ncbi:hypothetical protein [Actinobaculum suis]|uniref:hypothetical protein n=1 Tax=Actinobaculum suis TaxID=1657 RepID=UPI00159EC722|nr:hypothetical protein [Actinobaculum suis]